MNSLFARVYRLSLLLIVLLAVSCKKDKSPDGQNEKLYSLNFKLGGFTSSRHPLKKALASVDRMASTLGLTQNQVDGYLYFWSFNNGSLLPDVRVPTSMPIGITYNNGSVPGTFASTGYSFENYPAGQSLSLIGANEIIFEMPLQYVKRVSGLGFDMGSSGTGAKDFEIYFSMDNGEYEVIAMNNQFATSTNYSKNSFVYNLSEKSILGQKLRIKIVPKAGNRMGGSQYNSSQGIIRIDNFRVNGVYEIDNGTVSEKLHYFIYHKDNKDISATGVLTENFSNFDVKLPLGRYNVLFILNQSEHGLLLPEKIDDWKTLYIGNLFQNSQAEIFGVASEITVSKEEKFTFTLGRLYSQVKFEFTDVDIGEVDRIVVRQQHDPFFYVPSGTAMANPISDQSQISFERITNENKQFVFNQFLGLLNDFENVTYQLDVYVNDKVQRTFTVSSTLKHNMQLVFKGELLKDVLNGHRFMIHKNENWDGSLETAF